MIRRRTNLVSLFIKCLQVGLEGLQILKPMAHQGMLLNGVSQKGILQNGFPDSENQIVVDHGGVDLAVDIVTSEEDADDETDDWVVENLKFSVTKPVREFQSVILYHFRYIGFT